MRPGVPGGQAAVVAASEASALPVVERFVSINGEGLAAGRLAAFIRFAGCNLQCDYCDTAWANGPDAPVERLSAEALRDWVRSTGVGAVTLTGGEPLLQPQLPALVRLLLAMDDPRPLRVEVETNGSCDVTPLVLLREEAAAAGLPGSLHLTVDWKMPAAGQEAAAAMKSQNWAILDNRDAVKFVVGSVEEAALAGQRAAEAGLRGRCAVLLSPVWGQVEPAALVQAMKERGLNDMRLQLQMHKLIWPGEAKGV